MENPIGGGSLLLVVGGLYLTWCAVKYFKTKVWSWQPWRTPAPTSRQLTTRVPRPVTAIEQSNSHNTLYRAKDFTEETIQIIVP